MDAEIIFPKLARVCQIKIANRFDALIYQICHPSQMWTMNGIHDAVYTAAVEKVGHQANKYKCWIRPATREHIKHRRYAKKAKEQSQSEESKTKYTHVQLDKEVKNSAQQDWKNVLD